jgi:hypothetical protein
MSVPRPKSSSPQDPRDLNQLDAGPMISMQVYPDVGKIDIKKASPGNWAGRTIKAGK